MVLAVVAAGCLALAAGLVVLALTLPDPQRSGVARSLALIEAGTRPDRRAPTSELPARDRLVGPLLELARRLATALAPGGTGERLTRMLDRAGNPPAWTPDRLMGAKGVCLLLGLMLGLAYGGGLTLRGLGIGAALAAALFFLPEVLLHNLGLRRQEEARTGLAEALDMLTVCVEAGQGFDAALGQVSRNIDGPIAGEFARALSEVQIGKSRGEAFSGLGERIPTPEVKNFVTALVQADRLGLPIGRVLREQTRAMRLARRQRAEEKAQQVTVKILFPLMFCILPALFVVVLGPGVIRIMVAFSGQ